MLDTLSISQAQLVHIVGGNNAWADVRAAAQPHCPNTVARFTQAPTTRAEAQRIGNACLAEMGAFKAALGGRARIQAGIDQAFPR
jgi:hypothetical protein